VAYDHVAEGSLQFLTPLIAERKALDEYQKHLLDLAIFKRDAQ